MYPLGHMALGYLIGRIVSVYTKKDFNTLIIFFVSISPDIDIIIPNLLHRGPTHSVILVLVFFIPIFIFYKEGIPYLVALLSHSLIGDYFTKPGCKLFWPLSNDWFIYTNAWSVSSTFGISLEILLFVLMSIVIARERYLKYYRVRM